MNSKQLFSQACENNKQPIAEVLQAVFTEPGLIVEIGSGSGQHAVHMASVLAHLTWQPTDIGETLPSIEVYRAKSGLRNVCAPLMLDVLDTPWPIAGADGVFSANTAHTMPWSAVESMFSGVASLLESGRHFCLYGPFKYEGEFTSEGNRRLDVWARSIYPDSGVRDIERMIDLAGKKGFTLAKDHIMPANNQLLQFIKD